MRPAAYLEAWTTVDLCDGTEDVDVRIDVRVDAWGTSVRRVGPPSSWSAPEPQEWEIERAVAPALNRVFDDMDDEWPQIERAAEEVIRQTKRGNTRW